MQIETWLAFVAASAVLLVIPGPTILLVVSYGLGQGWRAAVPTAAGVAVGDLTAMTLSLLGVGAFMAASAGAFAALKLAGGLYLAWLGLRLWRADADPSADPRREPAHWTRMFGRAWLVTALNPKSITFFVAFAPQFLDPARAFWTQAATLEATFVSLAFLNALAYGLIAARTRAFARRTRALRLFNRIGGGMLIGAGLAAATLRNP